MILPRFPGFLCILRVQVPLWPGRVGGGTAGRVVVLLLVPLPLLPLARNVHFTAALARLGCVRILSFLARIWFLNVFQFLPSSVVNSGGIVPASAGLG